MIPRIAAIQEKSVLEKIPTNIAASDIAKIIRSYKQSEGSNQNLIEDSEGLVSYLW